MPDHACYKGFIMSKSCNPDLVHGYYLTMPQGSVYHRFGVNHHGGILGYQNQTEK